MKSRIGPLAIARDFASTLSVMGLSLWSPMASDGVASFLSAKSFPAGTSPVFSTSSASCVARNCLTARNSSTRSFTSLRP